MRPVIGIDFDNTLASYGDLMYEIAIERGLISRDVRRDKRHVRDTVRQLPDGEVKWQRIQAVAYGPRMLDATQTDGAGDFLRRCAETRSRVYIISHKTRFANYDETGTDLRDAAMSWIESQSWFDGASFGLSRDAVFFEPSRLEKLERIRGLGCTHFIDDLEETFIEPSFPSDVHKILYTPYSLDAAPTGVTAASNWEEIADCVLHS